jgi:hypothetical protein
MIKLLRRAAILARAPDVSPLTIADLPSPDTKRWVMRRKAIVAAAVRGGVITLEAASSRYRLNPEELLSWQYYIDRYGFSALRATKIQSYVRPGQHRRAQTYSRMASAQHYRRENRLRPKNRGCP